MLTWLPAGGARSYVVTVLKASDKSVVLHEATDKTYYPIHLEEGEFLWIVEPKKFNVAEFEQGHTNENPNIPYSYYGSFKVFVLSDSHEPIKNLNVVPLAARKDSYMLDLKWGERIIDADWDKPHNSTGYIDQFGNRRFTDPKHIDYDIEESWRCWAVVTAELNHYYYGNLTQDEIKFYYNNFRLNNGQDILFSNPILDAFPHDDKGDGILDQVLLWALNINQSDVSYYGNAQLSHLENFGLKGIEDIFVDALLQEHPLCPPSRWRSNFDLSSGDGVNWTPHLTSCLMVAGPLLVNMLTGSFLQRPAPASSVSAMWNSNLSDFSVTVAMPPCA